MALILILDQVDKGKWRRPRVKAVIRDGFVLYCEKRYGEETLIETYWEGTQDPDLAMVAQSIVAMGVGNEMRQEIADTMARMRAAEEHEEIRKRWNAVRSEQSTVNSEQENENDRPGNDSRPAGGDAGESGNGQ